MPFIPQTKGDSKLTPAGRVWNPSRNSVENRVAVAQMTFSHAIKTPVTNGREGGRRAKMVTRRSGDSSVEDLQRDLHSGSQHMFPRWCLDREVIRQCAGGWTGFNGPRSVDFVLAVSRGPEHLCVARYT